MLDEIATLLITAFFGLLKSVLEDGINGKLVRPPTPVVTAEDDPAIDQQAQNTINQWDHDHP